MRISDWSSDVCSSDLQNIGREGRDIAQRPGQQRRDNLFRHARGAVLAHMPISGDACSCSPGPRLEPETAVRQVIPEMVEIGDHLQELADDDGAPCWIIPQVARISIDQRLIDATKVEPPKPLTRECEEPACAVECLSDAGGWQLGAIAG